MLETTISNFIEQQFPAIYREEGQFFVEFMKQYYVWLETDPSSPVYQSRRYLRDHDIDTTVDDFLVFFKEKYLKNIQLNTATNTKQLIKNSIDLYRSKGTENAIKLFFDLIFSAPAEVYYPGNDIFKLSNAEWVVPQYVEISSKPVNRLMVGRSIVGVNTGATGFVEKLVRRKVKNYFIEVFYISAVTGEFQTGEIIKLSSQGDTPTEDFPVMLGSLTTLEVQDGGTGFEVGELVHLESKTGEQGRGIVEELQSVTGIVEFKLVDGGWGYTSNSSVELSEKVLQMANVQIESTTNTSLVNKIVNIVQPMANVQWYANTGSFVVGDVVNNYYANGVLIGTSKIISAEYGTSNTTNYFLLSLMSGTNQIDVAAPVYKKPGNTAQFTVQNAGWTNATATGTATGMSGNVYVHCTGNSTPFTVGSNVYQISTNNAIYAESTIESVTINGPSSFTLKVVDLDGLFLTNQTLFSRRSNNGVDITSLTYDIGVRDVSNSFKTFNGNRVHDTANGSLFSATVIQIPFGHGANVGFDDDLVNTEVVNLNPNYVRDHIDESLQRNWVNTASYGASLNNANLTNMILGEALQFDAKALGTIARLERANPGGEYSYAPFVQVVEPLLAPMYKMDFVIRLANTTGVFTIGELVTQEAQGARGMVKFANTSEVHIRRMNFEDKWQLGNTAADVMFGEFTGHKAYLKEITYDNDGIAGLNAVISTKVTSSNSSAIALRVVDSGFAFTDGQIVDFISEDQQHVGSAIGYVTQSGRGTGFYKTTSGFLSSNKYLYDGDYYQDFSYEIRSPITIGSYADMLKSVLHVSGTKAFSAILKTGIIDSTSKIKSSTVSQANT